MDEETSLEEEEIKRFKDWAVQKVWSIETIKEYIFSVKERKFIMFWN